MTTTRYQVTIGDRVVRVAVRRAGEHAFVSIDDGAEQPAALSALHGPLRSLALGERRAELFAVRSGDGVELALGGLEHQVQVLDEAHARLAAVAGGRSAGHTRRELKAPMP